MKTLVIDGAMGEGGGQILRSALALSLCLGKPFRMVRIRHARARPGLMRQHLAAVRAAAQVGAAQVSGASLGSQELVFVPRGIAPGSYRLDIGTAGSTSLVAQTVLPALLGAAGPSHLIIEGGTHNPLAPPYELLELAFLPLLRRMGARVSATLVRPGFYPAGGGRLELGVEPAPLQPLELLERGGVASVRARALIAHLPTHIARRELTVIGNELGLAAPQLQVIDADAAAGPGNAVCVIVECPAITEVFTGFGQRGVPAEHVAHSVVAQARRYLASAVPVGEHLADQLLVPVALARGGAFRTLQPSIHTLTNMEVIRLFTGLRFRCEPSAGDDYRIILP